MRERVVKSDEEWRRLLMGEQYEVTRRKGTEPLFSGEYHDFTKKGTFRCVCCGKRVLRLGREIRFGVHIPLRRDG